MLIRGGAGGAYLVLCFGSAHFIVAYVSASWLKQGFALFGVLAGAPPEHVEVVLLRSFQGAYVVHYSLFQPAVDGVHDLPSPQS